MNVRPFDWRDFSILYSYRHRGLFLDNTLLLTRGPVLVPVGALLASFAPAFGIFTYLYEDDANKGAPLVGQVTHAAGASFARLSFLAPETSMETADLPVLFDYIAQQIGERGAFHVLAEVEENSPTFRVLHSAGFAIYARQRIWQLEGEPQVRQGKQPWRSCTSHDILSVRTLYSNLVPGLVQQAEPLPRQRLKGVVLTHEEGLLAYIELRYGPVGIWAQPFVHPDAEDFGSRLAYMLQVLPNRRGRPIYLCVRTYQSWLEPGIEALGARPGPLQAVMVRHLAIARKASQPYAMPAMNSTRVEPTAPIARVK